MTACCASAVALDFDAKREAAIPLAQAAAEIAAGRFVWIDLEAADPAEARQILADLGLVGEEVIEMALREEPSTQYARYDAYVHLVVSGYRQTGDDFIVERVSVTLGQTFMLTIRPGPVAFMAAVRRDYRNDFVRFAKTPSFLLYEIWDHLIDSYLEVQSAMGDRVERTRQDEDREIASDGLQLATADRLDVPQVARDAVEHEIMRHHSQRVLRS